MHRIFSNFAYILLLGMSGMGLLMGKIVNGQNPTIFDGVTALSPFKKWFLACFSFILQRRTVTLTFPVHELSALD